MRNLIGGALASGVLWALSAVAPGSVSASDAFVCYKTRPAAGAAGFSGVSVETVAETESRSVDLKREKTLCVPADVGGGIGDADTHLRGYRSRATPGSDAYEKEVGVKVTDQIGDLFFDTRPRPNLVLVPTSVGSGVPAPDPGLHEVDHYRCQGVKASPGTVPLAKGTQITISDSFAVAKTFNLKKPKRLCTPVSALGAPVDDPAGSLLCYRARRARGEPKHSPVIALAVNNSLGASTLDTIKEAEICLPARAVSRCNGAAELCDRRYDEVSYATTHNAMSNAEEGWLGPNQNFPITTQLDDGIRAQMLDTWYFDLQPVLCHGGDIFACDFSGMTPLADGLAEITDFLDRRPNEVVSIIFESYITEADTEASFIAADLLRYVHVQPVGVPWPTLRELIEADTRLIVHTDDGGASLPWHHYVWDYAWETHFSFANPGEFSCDRNRGSASNELFILNHFLTNFIGSPALAEQVNHNPLFIDRALQCESESGRLPNFVTVDFYDIGDIFEVVDTLNGVAN